MPPMSVPVMCSTMWSIVMRVVIMPTMMMVGVGVGNMTPSIVMIVSAVFSIMNRVMGGSMSNRSNAVCVSI